MTGRILLVEDNATTAATVRVFLEAEGHAVVWADTGTNATRRFADERIDLVLLDLMLPDMDGLAVCRAIRTRSSVPIVMLTARTADDDVVRGLESGADDYVCKPFGSKTLLARVRRCLERARPSASAAELRHGPLLMDVERRTLHVSGQPVRLTRSEFDILHRLLRHPGRVFTRGQLIEHALSPSTGALDRTIDTHVWSLRRKIGEPPGAPRLILSEPGVGYRLSDARED